MLDNNTGGGGGGGGDDEVDNLHHAHVQHKHHALALMDELQVTPLGLALYMTPLYDPFGLCLNHFNHII